MRGSSALRVGAELRVGAAASLAAAERRQGFTLRSGSHPDRALAAAKAAGGAVAFEVLERLDPELGEMTRARLLKERAAHWRAVLGAGAV